MDRLKLKTRAVELTGMMAGILLGVPTSAYAHGEQALVAPAASAFLVLGSIAVALRWQGGWLVRSVLLAIVVVTHAALWFLPMAETPRGLVWTFLALIVVPLIAAQCAYSLIRRV